MAAEAKKLDAPRPAPDGKQPIAMSYWYSPFNPHTGIGVNVVVGGDHNDGVGTQGKVQSITLYPGGYVVIESLSRSGETKWLVVLGGQGRCA